MCTLRAPHPIRLLFFAASVSTAMTGCKPLFGGKSAEDSGELPDSGPPVHDTDDTDGGVPGPLGALEGVVMDTSGAPLAGVSAQLCWDVCKIARTEADGSFRVEAAPGRWALEFIVDSANPASGWATPLAPVDIIEDVDRALPSPVLVPMLDAVVPLNSPARVEVGSGLWIDAVPDEWEAPVLTPNAEPWVGGVQVDPTTTGLPLEDIDLPIAAVWYLAPVASHPEQPWAMTFTNAFGWPPGTAVDVWVADYGSQSWQDAGPAVVSEDGTELSGAQLSVFGTVLLFAPPAD